MINSFLFLTMKFHCKSQQIINVNFFYCFVVLDLLYYNFHIDIILMLNKKIISLFVVCLLKVLTT